jgi:hypothetical protein
MHAEHPEASPECQEAGDRDEDHGRDAQDENRDEPPDRRRGRDEFEDLHQPQRSEHTGGQLDDVRRSPRPPQPLTYPLGARRWRLDR